MPEETGQPAEYEREPLGIDYAAEFGRGPLAVAERLTLAERELPPCGKGTCIKYCGYCDD